MRLEFEYGHGTMAANLPDTTDVFIPGQTVPDPPCIPEDRIAEETLKSIRNPIGMEPLSQLAHKGSKCVIVFPDRVKGGALRVLRAEP
jgi:nickel-dependent lactate racemase